MIKPAPRPIGYVEVQRSWVGMKSFTEIDEITKEARETTLRDNPGLVQYDARIEHVRDGAGIEHCTLYMGFVPRVQTTPPLNPRNLGDAPAPRIGDVSADMGGVPLGWKESQFGRGT